MPTIFLLLLGLAAVPCFAKRIHSKRQLHFPAEQNPRRMQDRAFQSEEIEEKDSPRKTSSPFKGGIAVDHEVTIDGHVTIFQCLAVGHDDTSNNSKRCASNFTALSSAHFADDEVVAEGIHEHRGLVPPRKLLEELWMFCRTTTIIGTSEPCVQPGAHAKAIVIETRLLNNTNELRDGVVLPQSRPAKLMPFISDERYNGTRYVITPASRFDPRPQPVQKACGYIVYRIKKLIKKRRLQLLMTFDALGYFDVFRSFDTARGYSSNVKRAFLTWLIGKRMDLETAKRMWDIWIGRTNEFAAKNSDAPFDGQGLDRAAVNETIHTLDGVLRIQEQGRITHWEVILDDMLTGVYDIFMEVEADATVLQSIAMQSGVETRLKNQNVNRFNAAALAIIAGVAIIGYGGTAAPLVSASGLSWAVINAVKTGFGTKVIGDLRESADKFGANLKMIEWMRHLRYWLDNFVEVDPEVAFQTGQSKLVIKDTVKKRFICNREAKHTPQGSPCTFEGEDAELQLKESILASIVNLIMYDGGCLQPLDTDSAFAGSPVAAFGMPSIGATCCAETKSWANWQRGKCTTLDDPLVRPSCPEGWTEVDSIHAFDSSVPALDRLKRKAVSCCGYYSESSGMMQPYSCYVTGCSTKRAINTSYKESFQAPPEAQAQAQVEDKYDWRLEDQARKHFCSSFDSQSSKKICDHVRAQAVQKERRSFCRTYAARMPKAKWINRFWSEQQYFDTCIEKLVKMFKKRAKMQPPS